ncbi:FixH family protein [Candidatus Viridilinea mediisalina]|uniref:YtkA-like domain-containing protein n=1 Tax=Candidatus Viridilinea mediisalina TaxID=2024553 RepID=A0A2A6RLA3_9CHLR|nr:FixH family protein [Candidatus Viridilinea mediisalina]PDW03630.1 hypothetical protein CJ255_07745 [Candidatus Viridilinea mediisalina]
MFGNLQSTIVNGIMRIFSFSLLLLLFCLSACSTATRPSASYIEVQQVNGITISLATEANPKLHLPYRFTVSLSDAQGQPLESPHIYLDLDMPAMPMGLNRPIAEPEAPGRYSATTVYTMAGDWEITVVAQIEGQEYRAVFLIYVEEEEEEEVAR